MLDVFHASEYTPRLYNKLFFSMILRGILRIVSYVHSVHPPLSAGVGGGLSLQPNFRKGALDRTSTFRRRLLGKRGGDFFQGGVAIFT